MVSTAIKDVTREAHQQLEKQVVLRIKTIASDSDYAAFLKYFYAYFSAVEQKAVPFVAEVLNDYKERRNASYLKADIEALGSSVEALPEAQAPEINSVAEAFGALYVLEGSIMGGPYIIQMLQKHGIDKGFSFFSGYGAASGRMWKAFQDVLDEVGADEQSANAAMQKASETFEKFGHVFEAALV
ncbi:MAG: biliverdin-producing heme oxygenase [Chitinophagaceae bacterium]